MISHILNKLDEWAHLGENECLLLSDGGEVIVCDQEEYTFWQRLKGRARLTPVFGHMAKELEAGWKKILASPNEELMLDELLSLRERVQLIHHQYITGKWAWWYRLNSRDYDRALNRLLSAIQRLVFSILARQLDEEEEWTTEQRRTFLVDSYDRWIAKRHTLPNPKNDKAFVTADALVQDLMEWVEECGRWSHEIRQTLRKGRRAVPGASQQVLDAVDRLSHWHSSLQERQGRFEAALHDWKGHHRKGRKPMVEDLDQRFVGELSQFGNKLMRHEEEMLRQVEHSLWSDEVTQAMMLEI